MEKYFSHWNENVYLELFSEKFFQPPFQFFQVIFIRKFLGVKSPFHNFVYATWTHLKFNKFSVGVKTKDFSHLMQYVEGMKKSV